MTNNAPYGSLLRFAWFAVLLAVPGCLPALAEGFSLRPEPSADSLNATRKVDVNLGESPEAFVRLLWRQLTGRTPTDAWVQATAARLGTVAARRRIDLALQVAAEAKVSPEWIYSDPWTAEIPLEAAPEKKVKRAVGAMFMFFFTSPHAPNGGPGWADNHVPGMFAPAETLRFAPAPADADTTRAGYYHARNAGFWYRELLDARHAGLDFLLLNVYGPDLDTPVIAALQGALSRIKNESGPAGVKLGLFDDTWAWGTSYFGPFWRQRPDCAEPENAATLLYQAKWRPFFQALPRENWYLVQGRPLIYFYNAGTLRDRDAFAAKVLPRMKALFKADFGTEPFVALDRAFDRGAASRAAADTGYRWYTFETANQCSVEKWHDIELSHAMVRWDSVNRQAGGRETVALASDVLHKDDRILIKVLDETRDTDLLVIATWNDLGEGTGINRAYDYYWDGRWHAPDHFMRLIRRSQAGEKLSP